jgi:hypothetical protein
MPGTWALTTDWKWLPKDIRTSPADTQAFTQKVKRLAELIHQTPLFSPPRGFQARARAILECDATGYYCSAYSNGVKISFKPDCRNWSSGGGSNIGPLVRDGIFYGCYK